MNAESAAAAGRADVIWFDPTFGASGDMMLGALVGLGVDLSVITGQLETLDVDGWKMAESTVSRSSLSATRVEVTGYGAHPHRSWSSIDDLLVESSLAPAVVEGARRTFLALAQAEAAIHKVDIDQVHFHEVGAVDAIVDIVGAWVALAALTEQGVDRVVCGPIGLGHGTVVAAHGRLPLPAPATAALLQGVPVHGLDLVGETVTPTGAALLTTMAQEYGPLPAGTLVGVARGAGGRNPDTHPNVVSAYLLSSGRRAAAPVGDDDPDGLTVGDSYLIQTNLDDTTGEIVAHTIDRCLAAGADDAWAHPIVMKKGRPGVELNVLTRSDLVEPLRHIVLSETATLGLRISPVRKYAQPRRFESVEVDGQVIRIKVGPAGAKPEFDDLRAAAESLSVPVAEVSRRALQRFHRPSNDHH